jgi:glycosyltransferase involved in cell wall biosynthesis
MQILVVGNRVPWPLHDGGAVATYRMLEALSAQGNQLTYFTYNTQKHFVSEEKIHEYFPFCEVITVPLNAQVSPLSAFKNLFSRGSYFLERYFNVGASAQLTALIAERNFDLIQIEGLYSFPLLSKPIWFWGEPLCLSIPELRQSGVPVVYRAHNVEHEIWMRLAKNESNWLKRAYLNIQSKRLRKEELKAIQSIDAVVGISQTDCDYFGANNTNKVHLYLPSVKTALKVEIKIQPAAIFHIGSMEWDANVQGVTWFLSKVWPRLKSEVPDLVFHVAGKGIMAHKNLFFQTDVINHGEVSNATTFMQAHGIGVVPLLAGSGIRMKLIESLSLGIPCVATPIAVQGLPIENGKQLMVAADAEEFIIAIKDLLENRKKAIEMGKQAHAYCMANHNPTQNMSALIAFYQSLIG